MLETEVEVEETRQNDIDEIGFAAGKVWCFLDQEGPASLNRLTTNLDLSRELAMQAVGWLAREDKIVFEQAVRGRVIRLK